ncbi:hypothetical protein [Geminocystis herdmanii]|uniref:hypothetical protein n=1 Tax=Geminocystis herdmanii TaxID=669359 RepID=UPI00034BDBEE|nr:hypothetical protein [Geminocystis herdmanii]
MIPRTNLLDRFSTFLSIRDSHRFILHWQRDYPLKIHLEKIVNQLKCEIDEERLAYEFLQGIRFKPQQIYSYHLTSYLQEVCYWATKQVYLSVNNRVNSLTLSECFLWGNEAIIKPEKILRKYHNEMGSKITTYAQTRLKTIIKDKVYLSRGWQLLTNWGLLKKIAKSQRQQVLKKIGGLTGDTLAEYLLVWECFVDNYVSASPHKNKSLSPPSLSQLKVMISDYNILAKKRLNFPSELSIEQFKNKIEFCGEKARLFVNISTIELPQDQEINSNDNPENYLNTLEKNQYNQEINQILTSSFNNLNLIFQSIFYLGEGLNFTQQKIITTIQLSNPDFSCQQYQLSKNIDRIRKSLLDKVIQNLNGKKEKIDKDKIKSLIAILKPWLTEYIESEILLLCEKSFLEIDINQQTSLKTNYFQLSSDNFSLTEKIPSEILNNLRENFNKKLNLQLKDEAMINNSLMLCLEKFFHEYFNRMEN